MKILILRDDIDEILEHRSNIKEFESDALDNLDEANFAEQYLSKNNEVKQLAFKSDLQYVIKEIKSYNPDLVFNLVETICNSGAMSIIAVQMLEILGIPFTGSKMYAQLISADKNLAKEILLSKDIITPHSSFVPNVEYILKIRSEHASLNLNDNCVKKFSSFEEMQKSIKEKNRSTKMEWFAERYIDGREFNCAFLGQEILPPAEIRFEDKFIGHKILTYEAKWDEKSDAYQQSLRHFDIEDDIKKRLSKITEKCRNELHLKGYARVDFRMDSNGNLYVIDINTNPCISPDSGFVAMVKEKNISLEKMFEIIIQDAFIS